ncbi:magnesium protoporphyrin IX methyltransferase [Falsiroseomonas oryziterrae]|uniref:magnesium protoporphyrin IX methyltransferase n=1 Tax=Falsiroseomonas oryziterrae TaxID=2911368 RepID=UPI001F018E09|nr:magnesium protoporphyrin IX methyltransferase [Roseomonas sp. NPKOSM-4]
MPTATYQTRRGELHEYFDRTAIRAWERLTSDAPVSGIRATVRAGRDAMRATLLSWLPADLTGRRLLDAGCGTGALALEAAKRGAEVVAVDIAPGLIEIAKQRTGEIAGPGRITFLAGDMFYPALGRFDHVVAMDSLIHYAPQDTVRVLAGLAERTDGSIAFTFAPRTALLSAMHAAGRFFPRGDRAPSIVPVAEAKLRRLIEHDAGLQGFAAGHHRRIASGFYTSHALELVRR